MPIAKAQLDYWNGSAWVTAETPSDNNALIRFTIDEKMGQSMACTVKVSNRFNNPFSSTQADFKGKLSGVFTDFQRIRVIDSATHVVLFYGRIYQTTEKYDLSFGNVIDIEAMDALSELKDMISDGHDDINMTTSGTTYPTTGSPTTAVGKRSGLIKGLISLFSKSGNITFAGDSNRFDESATDFSTAGEYPLKKGGQKSILAHINSAAKDDPHTSAKKVATYDYYVDPNFQSRATSHEPESFFNYFKRGDRPSSTPATYALRIEYPTGGGLTRTGRIQPMMADYDFTRPKSELFTDAVCHYVDEGPATVGGATNKDKGWDIEEKTAKLELVKVKSISGSFVWSGKAIGGGTAGTDSAEEIKSGSTVVGRIQFMSATSGGSDSSPEYALVSDATSAFPATGTITGATSTSSSFQIVSRNSDTFGINKTARLGATNIDNADAVREQAVSRLRRTSDSILRGRIRIMTKPWYYLDSSSTTVSSNTITFGDLNPLNYGFRIGMTVNKVSSTGVVVAYGYATAVTSNSVTVGNGMSETVSTGNIIRLYIPIRASDSCYIINRLVNITGGDFQIAEINYTEDNGILSTELDVVGRNSGLGPPQNTVSRLVSAVSERENYTQPSGGTAQSAKVKLTCKFSQHSSNKHTTVAWTAGQLTVGANAYAISQGTQVFGSAGEHYLYYTGSGTGFSTSTVAAYTTDKDHTIVCWVNVLSTSDSESWLEFKSTSDFNTSVPDMGSASNLLNQRTIKPTDKLTSKSMEYFNADVVIKSSGDALTTYNSAGSAVTSFTMYFADGTTETISGYSNPFVTLGSTSGSTSSESTDQYIYADFSNNSINVTTTSSTAIGDTKVVLATCERVIGKDAVVNSNYSAVSSDLKRVNKGLDTAGASIGELKNGAVTLSSDIYFKTGDSGSARVEIVSNGIKGLDSSNVEQFTLNAANGKGLFGGGVCTISRHGIFFPQAAAGAATNGGAISWEYGGDYTWLYRETSGKKILLTHGGSSPVDGAFWIVNANVNLYGGDLIVGTGGDYFWGSNDLSSLYRGGATSLHSHSGGGDTNQNAYSHIAVLGQTTADADTTTDTVTFLAGTNITITTSGDSVTFNASGGGLSNWEEDGTTFRPTENNDPQGSTDAYSIGDANYGVGWLHFENAYGIKTNYNNSATTIWETHGHHEFEADVYIKSGNKLTCESELVVDAGAYNAPGLRFDSSLTSGLYYNSGVYMTVDGATKIGASTTINYNYQKVYIAAMDSTSGGVSVKWESGMLKQASSTERAKMNIRELEIDSSKIYDLETKSFEFRTPLRDETDHSVVDENGRLTYTDIPESTSFGLIAEAVNEVVPELVQSAANDGIPDGVDYPLLSVLLLTELKKLKARIEVLECN